MPANLLRSSQGSISLGTRPERAGTIIAGGSSGASQPGFSVSYTKDHHIEFKLSDGNQTVDLGSDERYPTGHARHITATWDTDGTDALYVDGQQVASGKTQLSDTDVSGTTVLGAAVDGSNAFHGDIQDITLYNYAPTRAQAHEDSGQFK